MFKIHLSSLYIVTFFLKLTGFNDLPISLNITKSIIFLQFCAEIMQRLVVIDKENNVSTITNVLFINNVLYCWTQGTKPKLIMGWKLIINPHHRGAMTLQNSNLVLRSGKF